MAVIDRAAHVGADDVHARRRDAASWPDWLVAAAPGSGPDGGDLTAAEIAALLDGLARRPGLAAHGDALRPAPGERRWECLYRDAHVDVWVIAWTGGADTGWHDHDSSSGAFRVLEGVMIQERPRWTGAHERVLVAAGEGLSFGPDHVHRVTVADDRAVTIHAYSPPLRRMGQYSLDPTGAMQRRTVTYEEELRGGVSS